MNLPRAVAVSYLMLFVLAFIVYAVAWPQAPVRAPDTAGYMRAARAISSGRIDQFQERTPGYPLLLLATGSTEAPSRLLFYVSLILYFIAVYLIAAVLHAAGIQSRFLIVCGCVMLLPPYIQIAAFALSEALTAFCLALAFSMLYFYVTRKHRGFLMAASAALAYAAITRPLFEFLALGLAAALGSLAVAVKPNLATLKTAVRDGLLLVSASAVAVGGYCLFNYSKFGVFGMTPLLGYALATRTSGLWENIPDLGVRRILVGARKDACAQGGDPAWAVYPAQAQLMAGTGKSEVDLGKYLQVSSLALIREHPERYLEDVARSFVEFWFPRTSKLPPWARMVWYGLHWVITGVFVLSFLVYAGHAVVALASRQWPGFLDTRAAMAWLIAVVILMYTAAISCAASSGDVRYREPADLLLLAAAGIGVVTLRRISASSRSPEREPHRGNRT